ncbi:MAG TPA: GNAT family N-acetyltransferase [Planococcus sp. (in: firmicutes)]|nr:GNAT family N-acetyltransferase [Planococcus sp. (in: firmicutes)]
MDIRLLGKEEPLPVELLLEADPSEKLIRSYCRESRVYTAENGDGVIGVLVLFPLDAAVVEIKNIAVAKSERGRGIGKKLIFLALEEAKRLGFCKAVIGTGNSSLGQLALYQKCGFRMVSIDRGFFLRNYPEPIVENGIPCEDMVRLEYEFL